MTIPDVLDYDRAAWRIGRNLAVIAAIGTAAGFGARGWKWGAGFFVGSLISWLNYRWLRRLVESLGGAGRPRRRTVILALRYALLGAVAYVILRFTSISPAAVFAGVFALTAAVFVEAIFEIVYARK
ncbi:MAG TPA: ATP synthase subunit I [Bryobacteraceae bacterium]|nr:ATP synthase subunit I [Bryobacteraceae bacterium]